MKNKKLFIILGIVLLIVVGTIVFFLLREEKEPKPNIDYSTYNVDKRMKKLENANKDNRSLNESIIITNYEEYSKYFYDESLTENDFKDHNYAIISLMYDNCGERNVIPTNYEINKDSIIVTAYYDRSCGLCAPLYDYYYIELDKSIENADIEINSIPRNRVRCDSNTVYKPIIYLYPTKTMDVSVKLNHKENISVSYPKYENGWNVLVEPNGTIHSKTENRDYYALYWEGNNFYTEVTNEGFVVSKENTSKFLEEKLKLLGLSDRESNEFIVYWLPKLEKNKYNYIRFETNKTMDEYMKLEVSPKPDTIIRVYMVYKPLEKDMKVEEQNIVTPLRQGFTVVEWGGSEIN